VSCAAYLLVWVVCNIVLNLLLYYCCLNYLCSDNYWSESCSAFIGELCFNHWYDDISARNIFTCNRVSFSMVLFCYMVFGRFTRLGPCWMPMRTMCTLNLVVDPLVHVMLEKCFMWSQKTSVMSVCYSVHCICVCSKNAYGNMPLGAIPLPESKPKIQGKSVKELTGKYTRKCGN